MDLDSSMATEPESKQAATEQFLSGESSSAPAPAAARPSPYGLTPEALKALEEQGSQVLVCSPSGRLLFHGSKALPGNSLAPLPLPLPLPADDPYDICADYDPKHHVLIVQQEKRKCCLRGPLKDVVPLVKAAMAQAQRPRKRGVRRKINQQLQAREAGSVQNPDPTPPTSTNVRQPILWKWSNRSFLIVIKKVAGNMELDNGYPITTPDPLKKKYKSFTLGVIFADWKLSNSALPALPLVPSPSSHLPWFYIADPGTSQGNHIFGNLTTQKSILVANSDLQSSPRLLYSKDGWMLFQGREVVSCFDDKLLPVFLLNPTTGARIDLPGITFRAFPGSRAAFRTTSGGTPEFVVYVLCKERSVNIYMVRPGDACWEEHPYEVERGPSFLHKMVLCGNDVYCFFHRHGLVFKLTDRSWHPITSGGLFPILDYAALELDGKVVMVSNPERFTTERLASDPIRFFRMEMSGDNFEWVEITGSNEELDGRVWFIDGLQSFAVKVAGSGQKMCWFGPKKSIKQGRKYVTVCAFHCLNLTTRAHRRLIADSVSSRQRAWVDLGCFSDCGLLDCGITGDDLLPGL